MASAAPIRAFIATMAISTKPRRVGGAPSGVFFESIKKSICDGGRPSRGAFFSAARGGIRRAVAGFVGGVPQNVVALPQRADDGY